MRKKNILGNFVKNPNVLYSHTPIRKPAWEHEAYTTLITFLPGCRELRVDCAGKEMLLAAPRYKWLMYLPMGERWCITAFYNPANELLEWYFDITRSNFIDEHGMPCIDDVFLDLVILPDGQAVTVDADELQEALDKGEISKEDFDNAYVVHDQIKDSKWSNVDFLNEISKKLMLEHELGDIPNFQNFAQIEPITKGWSKDKKYCVTTTDGQRILLRLSESKDQDYKKAEYTIMEQVYNHGVPTSRPLEFGHCNNGNSVYQLYEWIDGDDAEKALPLMSDAEQYVFGIKAGEALRKMHSVTIPHGMSNWKERYFTIIEERIAAYRAEGLAFKGSEIILEYITQNADLLLNRPQCFIHGDYHEGNLMVDSDGKIYVIDLLDEGFGNNADPWYDFKTFGENDNAYFSTGFVQGYFGGDPPQKFWDVLTYYYVTAALTGIVWTMYNKPEELAQIISWNERNAVCISEGKSPLMKWYLKDFYIQWTDGVPYKLKEPFDFSFLNKYGKVFKVFDDQDSGNICFGMIDGEEKRFVKFAGAPTERSNVTQSEAIERIKSTIQIYKDLSHPVLANLLYADEIGGGIACVFEWLDAECMGRQYPQSRERFLQISPEAKLQIFDDILSFHAHVAKQNYVAIDFYDGCIMYDFDKGKTAICDIELYEKAPATNNMGRMYGSSRFMSPEEFQLGATIDEITNVYTMGATAFALFGDERDRSYEKWTLSKGLFNVAKKAVSDERSDRRQSIEQFISEWRAAK